MILIFHSHRKNIMVQDTYKWVLQIYFICSTFAANKKIFQWQGNERKIDIFVENLYVDASTLSWCIFFLWIILNFIHYSKLLKNKKSETWNAYQHILYACYVSFTYYACSTPQVTTLTHKHMAQPYCMDMLPMSSDIFHWVVPVLKSSERKSVPPATKKVDMFCPSAKKESLPYRCLTSAIKQKRSM